MTTKRKIGFFEEAEGVRSGNRLVFIFGSFFVMLLTTFFAIKDFSPIETLAFFTGAMTSLAALKVSQKYIEKQK